MSLMRMNDPSGFEPTMMFANSSALTRRPRTRSEYWKLWPRVAGGWPTCPAGTWTFCSRIAAATSLAEMPSDAMRSGRSQMRMPKSEPKTLTSPTPLTRFSSSTM